MPHKPLTDSAHDADRLSEADQAERADARFREAAIAKAALQLQQRKPVDRTQCQNCKRRADDLTPAGYCNAECKADHERRIRRGLQ